MDPDDLKTPGVVQQVKQVHGHPILPFSTQLPETQEEPCLNVHWFLSLDDAARKIEKWILDYHGFRPHSALGNLVPAAFAGQSDPVYHPTEPPS